MQDELETKIKELLALAKTACIEDNGFVFPEALLDLRDLIKNYFEGNTTKPHSFWNRVKALDREKPGMKAEKIITDLFERIDKMKPDPVKTLIGYAQSDSCPASEGQLVRDLADYIFERRTNSLPNAEMYAPILRRVQSEGFSRMEPPLAADRLDKRFLAHCLFLDFFWQSHTWLDRYYKPLERAHDFAMLLENEAFMRILDKLLVSGCIAPETGKWDYMNLYSFKSEKKLEKRGKANERKQRQRKKGKSNAKQLPK